MKKSCYLCTRKTDKGGAVQKHNAEIAQLVEHNLAKVGVASSSLVFRSNEEGLEKSKPFLFSAFRGKTAPHTPEVNHRRIYTALSLYLSRVKWRVLRELVLSNWVK